MASTADDVPVEAIFVACGNDDLAIGREASRVGWCLA
jgi:hypothetical protein